MTVEKEVKRLVVELKEEEERTKRQYGSKEVKSLRNTAQSGNRHRHRELSPPEPLDGTPMHNSSNRYC
jgi:hypothetical protein